MAQEVMTLRYTVRIELEKGVARMTADGWLLQRLTVLGDEGYEAAFSRASTSRRLDRGTVASGSHSNSTLPREPASS